MATVTYTLSGDSVTFSFTPTTPATAHTYRITYTSGTLTGYTDIAGGGAPGPYNTTVTGLEPGQAYTFAWTWKRHDEGSYIDVEDGTVEVVVPPDPPMTATLSQWEDLASRIKALDTRITALENT